MKSFDRLCTDNQLQYFASSGTAIGAIRHKGFIPWDDDIDVYMPRADYNRLMLLRKTLSGSGYAIKDLGDNEYIYAFAKYYDARTTIIETNEFPKCVIGVYIDIFPLDEVDGTYDEIKIKKKSIPQHIGNFRIRFYPYLCTNLFHVYITRISLDSRSCYCY